MKRCGDIAIRSTRSKLLTERVGESVGLRVGESVGLSVGLRVCGCQGKKHVSMAMHIANTKDDARKENRNSRG